MINANTKTAALVFLLAGIIFAAIETGNRRKNVQEVSTPMVGGSLEFSHNGPWPDCVDKDKDYCAGMIKDIRDDLDIQFIPEGSMVTQDFRLDRVRIWYNEDSNKVVEIPHIS